MILTVLYIIVILLSIITAVRLMKVFEWTAILRGRKPYEISENENYINALLTLMSLVGIVGMFFYLNAVYYTPEYQLPEAASEHGTKVDALLYENFLVISLVFLFTQTLLMYFAYRYRYNKKRKAVHYSHNNRLELIWTVIPAIVLFYLVIKGLMVWNDSMKHASDPERVTIELYAKQFEWAARYAGDDKKLGEANYCMISSSNPLGLVTEETILQQIENLDGDFRRIDSNLQFGFPDQKTYNALNKELKRRKHQYRVVNDFRTKLQNTEFISAYDDVIISSAGEIVLPVGREIELKMRSQDVIHSAYLPHFRVHMYCVPGVETYFTFKPTITTKEMREKLGKDNFNYLLYCNNICGSSHFGMQMKVIVVSQEEYDAWWKEQKTFADVLNPAEEPAPAQADSTATPDSNMTAVQGQVAAK